MRNCIRPRTRRGCRAKFHIGKVANGGQHFGSMISLYLADERRRGPLLGVNEENFEAHHLERERLSGGADSIQGGARIRQKEERIALGREFENQTNPASSRVSHTRHSQFAPQAPCDILMMQCFVRQGVFRDEKTALEGAPNFVFRHNLATFLRNVPLSMSNRVLMLLTQTQKPTETRCKRSRIVPAAEFGKFQTCKPSSDTEVGVSELSAVFFAVGDSHDDRLGPWTFSMRDKTFVPSLVCSQCRERMSVGRCHHGDLCDKCSSLCALDEGHQTPVNLALLCACTGPTPCLTNGRFLGVLHAYKESGKNVITARQYQLRQNWRHTIQRVLRLLLPLRQVCRTVGVVKPTEVNIRRLEAQLATGARGLGGSRLNLKCDFPDHDAEHASELSDPGRCILCCARRLKSSDPELGSFGFKGTDTLRVWSERARVNAISNAARSKSTVNSRAAIAVQKRRLRKLLWDMGKSTHLAETSLQHRRRYRSIATCSCRLKCGSNCACKRSGAQCGELCHKWDKCVCDNLAGEAIHCFSSSDEDQGNLLAVRQKWRLF